MHIKKIIVSAFAGFSMLAAFAGTGSAGQVDINVYGASAQFLYWNAVAPTILSKQGCTSIQQAAVGTPASSKNGITTATCGSDTVFLRVSSKASFDGIEALNGIANTTNDGGVTGPSGDICSPGDNGYPGAVLAPYYRKMIDESTCTFGLPATPGTCSSTLKCQPVTVAISDVAGESFTQTSHGQLDGPLGGGLITRTFHGFNMPTTTFNQYNPIVVPFAFYVNTSVKACPYGTEYNA